MQSILRIIALAAIAISIPLLAAIAALRVYSGVGSAEMMVPLGQQEAVLASSQWRGCCELTFVTL